jgi:GMP synthase-like glutamine amidotransferase
MKALVLQHVDVEHPGVIREFFASDRIDYDTVELDAGEEIPALEPYDFMLVMGGPQDVWQEAEYPWLVSEKAAIRRFVMDMQRPYLGICLGHQLLATAIGGHVRAARQAEVGIMPIQFTALGREHALFRGISEPLTVLQWHAAEVYSLPAGTEVLAFSPACRIQAFRYGPVAYGLQCHIEITERTVAEWAAIPAYAAALERAMGKGAVTELQQAVSLQLPRFNEDARSLYRNLMSVISGLNKPVAANAAVA